MSDLIAEIEYPIIEANIGFGSAESKQYAEAAAASASEAAADAESIADSAAQIAENTAAVGKLSAKVGGNFRAAAAMKSGNTYRFVVTAAKAGDVSFTFGRTYTVTYNAMGGTGAPASQVKYYSKPMVITTDTPAKEGYTFLGWSTDKTATEPTYSPGGIYTVNNGTIMYAIWTEESVPATTLKSSRVYTVTFTAAGEKAYYEFTPTGNYSYYLGANNGSVGSVMLYDQDGNELDGGCDTGLVTSVNGMTGDVTISIPTVSNDFTDEYKQKVDELWEKLSSLLGSDD